MKTIILLAFVFITFNLSAQTNDELLIKACWQGDLVTIKQNVDGGANVNYKNKDGLTPLSVSYLWPEQTEYLLSKGADPNGGDSPELISAARYYSLDVMKLLLKAGADPNKTATLKIGGAATATFTKLIEDEKAKKKPNETLIKAWETTLASLSGDIILSALGSALGSTNCKECVELLLNSGARTDLKGTNEGNVVHELLNWLPVAQRADHMKKNIPHLEKLIGVPDWYRNLDITNLGTADDFVKLLVANGADLENLDKNKHTPMQAALLSPNPNGEAMAALLDNGAKLDDAEKEFSVIDKVNANALYPNITYSNGDYLLKAVISGHAGFVKSIVEKFPQLTNKSYEGEGTLTCGSVTRTNFKVKGIDLMMVAAEHGNPEIVKYLIEKEIGGRSVAQASQTTGRGANGGKAICPLRPVYRVQAFAKNSGNQEVMDIVKAARLKNY